jgi:hypothetical protein
MLDTFAIDGTLVATVLRVVATAGLRPTADGGQ